MRVLVALLLAFVTAAHAADEFPVKKIKLTVGKTASLNPVLTLPYDGPPNTKQLRVFQNRTAKRFPATIKDGQLTFIPEGGLANTEHTYELKDVQLGAGYEPIVNIKQRGPDSVDVFIEDLLFTTYYFPKDGKKPYLWPVNSAGGVPLTRDYPMDPNGLPKDHPHHRSCWSSFGDINGVDCWTEGGASGFQASGEVMTGSGDAFGWIHAKNVWQDKDRKPVLDEEREYRFYAMPEAARMFDVSVTFTASHGDVKFGDTKEGGIVSLRMRPEMSMANAIITNALGDVGEPTLWGKPAPWCDFSANLKEGARGITVFDNPANLHYPTSWHVRAYGLMGANPFGWKAFLEKEYNKPFIPAPTGEHTLKNGEKLTFKYRVYVHSGDVKEAAVADRFTDYATPPTVAWLEE